MTTGLPKWLEIEARGRGGSGKNYCFNNLLHPFSYNNPGELETNIPGCSNCIFIMNQGALTIYAKKKRKILMEIQMTHLHFDILLFSANTLPCFHFLQHSILYPESTVSSVSGGRRQVSFWGNGLFLNFLIGCFV